MQIESCKLKIAEAWVGIFHFSFCNLQFAIGCFARRSVEEQF